MQNIEHSQMLSKSILLDKTPMATVADAAAILKSK